ncbi:MAG: RodZ domain-containing protein [Wenzhouxiangella sp.]
MIEQTSNNNQIIESEHARIGTRLRKERIRQKLSDREVASHLRLSEPRVRDLEEGRADQMVPLYWRGYVSSYARFLGLDPTALLSNIEPEQPSELREVLPTSRRAWKFDRMLKFATYALVTTVIVPPLVIIYLQSGWRMVDADSATANSTGGQAVSSSEERMAGRITRALALDENDQSAKAAPSHLSASALPLNAVRRPVESADRPATSILPVDPDADAAEPDLTVELTLRLRDDTWVEITDADGQRLEYDMLRAGQLRMYRGLHPFRILLGRANSVELELNGETVEYEGHDRGEVVQLQLLAGGEVVR